MTAFSQTGCTYLNIHPDLFAQIFVFNPDVATIWSVPLLLSLAMVLLVDERVEFVKEVKELMVDGVIPNVAPTWSEWDFDVEFRRGYRRGGAV